MALVRRLVDLTFQSISGQTFADGTNTIDVTGLRVSAKIVKAGGNYKGRAQLRIWGLTLSIMNQLNTLGMRFQLQGRNTVTVKARDENSVPATVFIGQIVGAYIDFSNAPDVSLYVDAATGIGEAVVPAMASSFPGSADVAAIMSSLATTMGLKFENSGVQAKLSDPVFTGSAWDQMNKCAEHAGIEAHIIEDTLAIWPKGGSRGGLVPVISKDTGMIGFPTYTEFGIMVRALFNPSVGLGGKIQVESILKPATGTWAVFLLAHDLDSLIPNGKWESEIGAYNPAFPKPVL